MSLIGLALRICTVKALTGRTMAEGRVFDSSIAPLDVKVEEAAGPLIVVYTDDEEITLEGKDMLLGRRDLALMIHFAVASKFEVNDGAVSVEMPHTDEGLEAALDFLRHDILTTLQCGTGEWSKLWRELVVTTMSLSVRRGASALKGLRFAGRELVVHVDTLADPAPSKEVRPFYEKLVEQLRSDPDLGGIADLFEERLKPDPALEAWQVMQAKLGLTQFGIGGSGLGPVQGLNVDETPLPLLDEVTLHDPDGVDLVVTAP